MKLANIKIGTEYLIRDPRSRWRGDLRAKITRVGVYGTKRSRFGAGMTKQAHSVEFEPVSDDSDCAGRRYHDSWVVGKEIRSGRYGVGGEDIEYRYRASITHVVSTWEDYRRTLRAARIAHEKMLEQNAQTTLDNHRRSLFRKGVIERAARAGIQTGNVTWTDHKITIDAEILATVLQRLEEAEAQAEKAASSGS